MRAHPDLRLPSPFERRRRPMSSPEQPDVWRLLFEQLPTALRWIIGGLSLGMFTLAGYMWRRQERTVQRIEDQLHRRMDREMADVHRQVESIHQRLDKVDEHLLEIARNTRK